MCVSVFSVCMCVYHVNPGVHHWILLEMESGMFVNCPVDNWN